MPLTSSGVDRRIPEALSTSRGKSAGVISDVGMTDTMRQLTGEAPANMRDFVKLHAAEFKQRGPAHS